MAENHLLMTVDEAAGRLRMNRSAIYRAIGSGALVSIKFGRMRRVSERALEEFIARQEGRTDGREPAPLGRRPGAMETR